MAVIGKFNRADGDPLKEWIGITDTIAKLGRDTPRKLALRSNASLTSALIVGPAKSESLQLRADSALLFAGLSSASFRCSDDRIRTLRR